MKKIVVLNGSPHPRGCTSALAEEVVKAAAQQGAEFVIYHLNTLNIRGCQACLRCNMKFMGFGDYKILVAGGTHAPEHVTSQRDVLEEAARMGQWLSA
jgi:multimeric flavodoxin WrbA